jgi:hypothetical protein
MCAYVVGTNYIALIAHKEQRKHSAMILRRPVVPSADTVLQLPPPLLLLLLLLLIRL